MSLNEIGKNLIPKASKQSLWVIVLTQRPISFGMQKDKS
jgi:hypothetical protein